MSKPWDDPRIRSATQLSQYDRRAWIAAGRPPLAFEPQPKPKPAQPATMTPDTSRTWNEWAVAHVQRGMDSCMYTVGQECGKIESRLAKRIADLEKEVGELRGELNVQRALAKSEIIDLPDFRRKRNDAAA
jgi:hypothetical protein